MIASPPKNDLAGAETRYCARGRNEQLRSGGHIELPAVGASRERRLLEENLTLSSSGLASASSRLPRQSVNPLVEKDVILTTTGEIRPRADVQRARQSIVAHNCALNLQKGITLICSKCYEEHSLDEMELTFRRPDAVVKLSEDDRARLVKENNDLCVIEGKRFFIRALLPLPVKLRERPYCIGLWVEVSQATFEHIYELWESEAQVHEPSFAAQIANEIPTTDGSCGLDAELRLTGPATRPEVFLQVCSRQLYIEQAEGIGAHRASEYSALFG